MTFDSEKKPASAATTDPLRIFTYRGRIGRGGYFLGLLVELGLLFLALVAFANAMKSTDSSGGPGLFLVVGPIVIWIHSVITVGRLRDAGKPAGSFVLFAIAPIILIGGMLATLNDSYEIAWLIVLVTLVLVVIPGLMPSKPDDATNLVTGQETQ